MYSICTHFEGPTPVAGVGMLGLAALGGRHLGDSVLLHEDKHKTADRLIYQTSPMRFA